MTVQVIRSGTVELKPECRKRIASLLYVSLEEVKKAESDCDGVLVFCLDKDGKRSTNCFVLSFPALDEEIYVPTACFVGYSEDEE